MSDNTGDSQRGRFRQLGSSEGSGNQRLPTAASRSGEARPIVDPAWISLANCFAGGVLLSAGYAHFLPDVVRSAI